MYQLSNIRIEFEDEGEKLVHVLRLPKTTEMLAYERVLARIASSGEDTAGTPEKKREFLASLEWTEAKCTLWWDIVQSIEGYDLAGVDGDAWRDLVPIAHKARAVDQVLGKNAPRAEEKTASTASNPPSED